MRAHRSLVLCQDQGHAAGHWLTAEIHGGEGRVEDAHSNENIPHQMHDEIRIQNEASIIIYRLAVQAYR